MVLLGFGAIGSGPIGGMPPSVPQQIEVSKKLATISVSGIILPEQGLLVSEKEVAEGLLIKSTSAVWAAVVERLRDDWSLAFQLSPQDWEELVAGAYTRAGYETVLTPRSGDYGRDVIATKRGVGAVRILGSVKAYKPGHLVEYDAVRSLIGVVAGDRAASKGIISTTSDFPPKIMSDPIIAPHLPTRLELMNGQQLQQWLRDLSDPK
jgi:restriction system protein